MTEQEGIDPLVARLEDPPSWQRNDLCKQAAALLRSQSSRITALDERNFALVNCLDDWKMEAAEMADAAKAAEARLADALAALRPFVTYTPEDVLDGNGRFVLVKTTESGGGWFGSEDFRRARATLSRLTAEQNGGDE